METSLHRQLKMRYAVTDDQTEVTVDGFRIDAISAAGELIEIQHASLGALRDKTRQLLATPNRTLRIVKPIIARKRIVTLDKRGGDVLRSRLSPKRGELLDVFEDLVHFASVFPQPGLILEVVLIESEETRLDRVRASRRGKKYITLDQRLVEIQASIELRTRNDLLHHLPVKSLPKTFDTAELAALMKRPRWLAQKVCYCLRQTGAARTIGKRGNSVTYKLVRQRGKRAA
ncbi:hypothetical protein [Aureliella helgolandensis]|uniref:DUF8091 domain-containing protein n=1 Tax=Aureliella helgolandensis TaxID=2527968 RepID=A0A518G645_9BACT|nr:hypothetical protein [Aureliella helgolandensis]QDV24034.1 hypothetical protein Q31a_23470 [Aureliella helgolandensis]